MAPGNVHRAVWKANIPRVITLTLGVIVIFHRFWWSYWFAGVLLLSYLSGKYIEPDLDQPALTVSDSSMKRDFPIVGYLMVLWWTIYAYVVFALALITGKTNGYLGGHRTWASHSIFPGTVLRQIWLDIPIMVPFWIFNWDVNQSIIPIVLGQFAGLAINDLLHLKYDRKGIDYDKYEK